MSLPHFLVALASLFGIDVGPGARPVSEVRRVVIEDTVIFRVPIRPMPPMGRIEWVEHKGPKCLPIRGVAGALLASEDQIDFVMGNRSRIRAELDSDCPALDFYGGFYVEPDDERLCAKRDEIRSRVGGSCMIRKFKTLVPQAKN